MIGWDDKYSVNVSMIDDEHKKFIDIINKAIVAKQHDNNPKEVAGIIDEMLVYAHKHFKGSVKSFMKKREPRRLT
ncbi:MAG: Bacteriohemerythrin [Candidatus Scalindua rubra]|uniref:Bacteriohemerythrin n=1 Tax=Candidatus Scalindua rubra TaxID=1872076 RepID=A0A1E3XA46_9BACT|nr:MAG: Bacteriohemerythrin [Candidatus Scalindua rubra]